MFGRMFDKSYLDAIGWKGIRQRKIHLKQSLNKAIDDMSSNSSDVRILDIATGAGRYVLETIKQSDKKVTALLRDNVQGNIDLGKKTASELGLGEKVTFKLGDAFSRDSILSASIKPNIVIVSGLYELFSDNAMISESLKAIAEVIEDGGYLLYTGQPWHPQVEMIARTLNNRDGDMWVMRRRSQAELDEIVRAAGFDKRSMLIDEYGIFTVSVARKAR